MVFSEYLLVDQPNNSMPSVLGIDQVLVSSEVLSLKPRLHSYIANNRQFDPNNQSLSCDGLINRHEQRYPS